MIRHKNRYSTRPVIGSKWQLILMSTRGVQGARTSYNNRVVLALLVLLWDLLECGRSQSTTGLIVFQHLSYFSHHVFNSIDRVTRAEVGYTGHIWGHILRYNCAIFYRYLNTY